MRAHGTGVLAAACADGRAIAAISTYTLESTRAICAAAEAEAVPVILQAGASSFAGVGRHLLAASALAAADDCSVAVGVHLDHSSDLEEIRACVELGYTSVMVDGSHLPFEENVKMTSVAVRMAHDEGVWVEAELGVIPGNEDTSRAAVGVEGTDVAQAAEFAERTGVDALAVAIGNVHGIPAAPVVLDIPRLVAIRRATPVPLVLHGASGLPDAMLASAIRNGVCKVNVNTEVRRAHIDALRTHLSAEDSVLALQHAAVSAMTAVARQKIRLFAGAGGAVVASAGG